MHKLGNVYKVCAGVYAILSRPSFGTAALICLDGNRWRDAVSNIGWSCDSSSGIVPYLSDDNFDKLFDSDRDFVKEPCLLSSLREAMVYDYHAGTGQDYTDTAHGAAAPRARAPRKRWRKLYHGAARTLGYQYRDCKHRGRWIEGGLVGVRITEADICTCEYRVPVERTK
jgi:hypothetical protein